MNVDTIILAFHKAGYRVASAMQAPRYVTVTTRNGLSRRFPSYRAAYQFYFGNK